MGKASMAPQSDRQPRDIPFVVGEQYERKDVYRILGVPQDKQRGSWDTGYRRWGDDLFIFSTVGSPATLGYDYDNRWEGDVFVWYAKGPTTPEQPLIQWMMSGARHVFIFTRPAVRQPFTFEGLGEPISSEETRPVLIRWRVNRSAGARDFEILPSEETSPARYLEGATRQVSVNAYERNPQARRACIRHHGCRCQVCGFDFEAVYGTMGRGFTHVHHKTDLATVGRRYEVDPINDLSPVCPNCHAMLHTARPAMGIEELRAIVAAHRM
jgi:hypothetical protein